MVIVDPGVGSERLGIIVKTPSAFFVCPDNGILSYVMDELYPSVIEPVAISNTIQNNSPKKTVKEGLEIAAITDPRFWHHPVSPTFHGRDIFAPVAAGLSLGISLYEFGEKITSLIALPIPLPYLDPQGNLTGQVSHIDHFGNLITNIKNSDLPSIHHPEPFAAQEKLHSVIPVAVEIAGRLIHGLHSYYAQGESLMAMIGSSGYLEISLRTGDASDLLGVGIGDEVRVISS